MRIGKDKKSVGLLDASKLSNEELTKIEGKSGNDGERDLLIKALENNNDKTIEAIKQLDDLSRLHREKSAARADAYRAIESLYNGVVGDVDVYKEYVKLSADRLISPNKEKVLSTKVAIVNAQKEYAKKVREIRLPVASAIRSILSRPPASVNEKIEAILNSVAEEKAAQEAAELEKQRVELMQARESAKVLSEQMTEVMPSEVEPGTTDAPSAPDLEPTVTVGNASDPIEEKVGEVEEPESEEEETIEATEVTVQPPKTAPSLSLAGRLWNLVPSLKKW
jgi:hypothetical protein